MEKRTELKEVLPFYIGCQVSREHIETRSKKFYERGKLVGVSESEVEYNKVVAIIEVGLDHFHEWYAEETIPHLRRLSSMTEEEGNEIYFRYFGKRTTEDWTGDTGSAYFRPKQIQASKAHALRIIEGQDYSTGDFMTVVSIVPYMLSKGFDLFSLIDSGQAIEQTEQE